MAAKDVLDHLTRTEDLLFKHRREDYEYQRAGTRNLLLSITKPHHALWVIRPT